MVLNNNIFQFGENTYQQIDGTAIGSKLGKNYACTCMGHWEKQLLTQCQKKPALYLRFVDDIFGIWEGNEEELKQFQETANKIHPRIQVELTYSKTQIEFLDVLVKIREGNIDTTIFEKPTDRHMYLHNRSDHPRTTKNAIPYGLGIRAKRICSTEEAYMENRKKIIDNLDKRGYNKRRVSNILEKVDKLDRKTLLEYKDKKQDVKNRVPLVMTYGSKLPDVQNILHKRMDILHRSSRMKKVCPHAPLTAYRRDSNLEDILVHAKHKKMFSPGEKGTDTCGSNCAICKHMAKGTQYQSSKEHFTFNDKINCKTSNVVYGIHCHKCNRIIYVGETGTSIYERFQNHLSCIRRYKMDPISNHFNNYIHNQNDLKIVGIEKMKIKDIHYRKIRESFWIKKMGTLQPEGLNQNLGIGDGDRGVEV